MKSFLPGAVGVYLACVLVTGCHSDRKHELERKYDQLKLSMTAEQVTAVLGEGKPVTAAEIATFPEHPKLAAR